METKCCIECIDHSVDNKDWCAFPSCPCHKEKEVKDRPLKPLPDTHPSISPLPDTHPDPNQTNDWRGDFDRKFTQNGNGWSAPNIYRDGGKNIIAELKAFIQKVREEAVRERNEEVRRAISLEWWRNEKTKEMPKWLLDYCESLSALGEIKG